MTIVPTNRATPAQIAAFRAGQHRVPAKHKHVPYVSFVKLEREDGFELQLPIKTIASQARGHFIDAWEIAAEQAAIVVDALLGLHVSDEDRSRIYDVCFTRIGPAPLDAHDNLPQSFKHPVDGWCFWAVLGEEARAYVCNVYSKRQGRQMLRLKHPAGARFSIGKYDDQLLGTGKVSCRYAQLTHEIDRSLYGVRIRFRLKPK